MSLPSMQKLSLDSLPLDKHGKIVKQTAELHGITVIRVSFNPGAKWSVDLKDHAGTPSCELPHVALMLQGTLAVQMDDGSEGWFSRNDVMMLPPGHDAWCVRDEPAVFVEFSRGGDYYGDQKK